MLSTIVARSVSPQRMSAHESIENWNWLLHNNFHRAPCQWSARSIVRAPCDCVRLFQSKYSLYYFIVRRHCLRLNYRFHNLVSLRKTNKSLTYRWHTHTRTPTPCEHIFSASFFSPPFLLFLRYRCSFGTIPFHSFAKLWMRSNSVWIQIPAYTCAFAIHFIYIVSLSFAAQVRARVLSTHLRWPPQVQLVLFIVHALLRHLCLVRVGN